MKKPTKDIPPMTPDKLVTTGARKVAKNNKEQVIPRKVPTYSAEVIAGLQSSDPVERAKAALTVAESFVPQIERKVQIQSKDASYVRNAVFQVFEEKGGISAYADWAMDNETEYYRQFVTLGKELDKLPQQATQINIVSNIPKTSLDANTNQTFNIVGEGSFTVDLNDEEPQE